MPELRSFHDPPIFLNFPARKFQQIRYIGADIHICWGIILSLKNLFSDKRNLAAAIVFSATLLFSVGGYLAYSGGEVIQSIDGVRIEIETDESEYHSGENITGKILVVNDGNEDIVIRGYAYKVRTSQSDIEYVIGADLAGDLVVLANSRAVLFEMDPAILQKLKIAPGYCKLIFTIGIFGTENYNSVGETSFMVLQ